MLTVDEITAEVESRRESIEYEESDGWTAVNPSETDAESIKEFPEDEDEEEEEDEEDEEMEMEESEGELTEGVETDEDDTPGKPMMAHGGMFSTLTFIWPIFIENPRQRKLSSGSKELLSALGPLAKYTSVWMQPRVSSWQ